MFGLVYKGDGILKIEEFDLRKPGREEVLVKVLACGICGTDLRIVRGESGSSPPVVLGHEFGGVVEEVGENVESVSPGDRVVVDPNICCGKCRFCRAGRPNLCENLTAIGVDVNGGFAEYCIVPERQLFKLKRDVALINMVMVEPLSCVLNIFNRVKIDVCDRVIIIGGGIIGYTLWQLLKIMGISNYAILEIVRERVKILQRLSVENVFNPQEVDVREAVGWLSEGADVVVECAGSSGAFELGFSLLGRGGRMVVFGVAPFEEQVSIKLYDIFRKEVEIIGSFVNPFTFDMAVCLINSGKMDYSSVEYRVFSLSDYVKAFEAARERKYLKVLMRPEREDG